MATVEDDHLPVLGLLRPQHDGGLIGQPGEVLTPPLRIITHHHDHVVVAPLVDPLGLRARPGEGDAEQLIVGLDGGDEPCGPVVEGGACRSSIHAVTVARGMRPRRKVGSQGGAGRRRGCGGRRQLGRTGASSAGSPSSSADPRPACSAVSSWRAATASPLTPTRVRGAVLRWPWEEIIDLRIESGVASYLIVDVRTRPKRRQFALLRGGRAMSEGMLSPFWSGCGGSPPRTAGRHRRSKRRTTKAIVRSAWQPTRMRS